MDTQKLSFPIAAILRNRDRLVKQAFRPMGPIMLRGQFLDELVDRVVKVLPDGVSRDAVFESLRYLAGTTLTDDASVVAAWRLAGNVQRLRQDMPTPPWAAQSSREWVPLEAIAGKPFRNQYNRRGYFLDFRIMAGTSCPMRAQAFWSDALCRAMSRRLGFSAPWDHYPYQHPMEFVRLRCVALVEPHLSKHEPKFKDLHEEPPATILTWNRKVLKPRKRIQPCPRGWAHACHKCAVGYNECPGGVHRLTYAKGPCLTCGNNAYFDSDLSTERCVNCQHRLLLSRTKE